MSPRGGRRNGSPGVAYQQRTDLNAPKPLAPTAAPSQTYGVAAGQLRSQQQIPMAPSPPPGLSQPAPEGAGPPGASQTPPAGPLPGAVPFGGPTMRPNEPVTAGLPIGAGLGPSPMPQGPDPLVIGASVHNALKEPTPQGKALTRVVNATLANRAAP